MGKVLFTKTALHNSEYVSRDPENGVRFKIFPGQVIEVSDACAESMCKFEAFSLTDAKANLSTLKAGDKDYLEVQPEAAEEAVVYAGGHTEEAPAVEGVYPPERSDYSPHGEEYEEARQIGKRTATAEAKAKVDKK